MTPAFTSDACAWHGPVSVFLEATAADRRGARGDSDLLTALTTHCHRCMNMGPDVGQVSAWRHEIAVLRQSLADAAARVLRAQHWEVIFEYELPRERGRRPDVVILTGSQVMVLEFKDAATAQLSHIDQVAAYARDLSEYHAASHDKLIDPVLVLTLSNEPARVVGEEGRGARFAAELREEAAADSPPCPPGAVARRQPTWPRPVTITGPATSPGCSSNSNAARRTSYRRRRLA